MILDAPQRALNLSTSSAVTLSTFILPAAAIFAAVSLIMYDPEPVGRFPSMSEILNVGVCPFRSNLTPVRKVVPEISVSAASFNVIEEALVKGSVPEASFVGSSSTTCPVTVFPAPAFLIACLNSVAFAVVSVLTTRL